MPKSLLNHLFGHTVFDSLWARFLILKQAFLLLLNHLWLLVSCMSRRLIVKMIETIMMFLRTQNNGTSAPALYCNQCIYRMDVRTCLCVLCRACMIASRRGTLKGNSYIHPWGHPWPWPSKLGPVKVLFLTTHRLSLLLYVSYNVTKWIPIEIVTVVKVKPSLFTDRPKYCPSVQGVSESGTEWLWIYQEGLPARPYLDSLLNSYPISTV